VKRPAGVSFLALLLFCYGVLLVVHTAQSTPPDFELNYINTHLQHLLPGDRTDTMGVLCFSGVGALIALLIAGGLWLLKEPARWGLMMISGIPVVRGLIQAAALIATDSGSVWKEMGDLFWFELFLYALLILYLFRPDVQLAFRLKDRYAGAFEPTKEQPHEYDREP
jgi:hypothetical protein